MYNIIIAESLIAIGNFRNFLRNPVDVGFSLNILMNTDRETLSTTANNVCFLYDYLCNETCISCEPFADLVFTLDLLYLFDFMSQTECLSVLKKDNKLRQCSFDIELYENKIRFIWH